MQGLYIPTPSKGCFLVGFKYLKASKKHPFEGLGIYFLRLSLAATPDRFLLSATFLKSARVEVNFEEDAELDFEEGSDGLLSVFCRFRSFWNVGFCRFLWVSLGFSGF